MARRVRTILWIGIGVIGVGTLIFGPELLSYARTTGRSVQRTIKSNIPPEFELQRARDLLDASVPEMHANVRLIAEEEIEIENLERDIAGTTQRLAEERGRIDTMRQMLTTQQVSYTFGRQQVSHEQLRLDLANRFERFKEAQLVLTSKERLLSQRSGALEAARGRLEEMRAQKCLLEQKIEALAAQHRLIQAAARESDLTMDDGKIAQTGRLIEDLRKRLDVAERVLAHEARFTQPIAVDALTDADLLAEVEEYFADGVGEAAAGEAQVSVAGVGPQW